MSVTFTIQVACVCVCVCVCVCHDLFVYSCIKSKKKCSWIFFGMQYGLAEERMI